MNRYSLGFYWGGGFVFLLGIYSKSLDNILVGIMLLLLACGISLLELIKKEKK